MGLRMRFWLWVYVLKHWVLAGYYQARSETLSARVDDQARGKAHEELGDAAARVLARMK